MARAARTPTIFDHLDFPPYEHRAYPVMLYHPQGKRVGRGAFSSIQSIVVNNSAEAEALRTQGWHDHPGKAALAAANASESLLDPNPGLQAQLAKSDGTIALLRAKLRAAGVDPDAELPEPVKDAEGKEIASVSEELLDRPMRADANPDLEKPIKPAADARAALGL